MFASQVAVVADQYITEQQQNLIMAFPRSDQSVLFSSLPKWRAPWQKFVLSYGAQIIIVAILAWVPVLHPEVLEGPPRDYHAIELVPTPIPVDHQPQRQLAVPKLEAKLEPLPAAAMVLPAPQPHPKPKLEAATVPEVKIASRKPEPLPASTPVMPKQAVRTNVFSTGSSAPQTIDRTPDQVQTGGFGDPNGVPGRTIQTRAVNIAQSGGFDMPTGPGYGNGTGGSNGVRGVVASAGFGGGVAVANVRSSSASMVRQAGFGDADVPAPAVARSVATPAAVKVIPAEIISKPVPLYTEEARNKRIEGEVLLEVVLEASGKLRVLRIVRGLGHGLDDSAVRAAEQIRFKPALKDGQPYDSTAVVHIVFQLA